MELWREGGCGWLGESHWPCTAPVEPHGAKGARAREELKSSVAGTSGGWGPMGDDAIHGMDAGMGGLRLAHDIP